MSGPAVGVFVLYDLRDPSAWLSAHRHRLLWGKRFCDFHFIGPDHVVLIFKPGGARRSQKEAA
jgi:hypothetical protein